jgi:hypothetical protein
MRALPVPTFFIVGAPRCGTTSLYWYLSGHPDVFVCRPKEPHHLGSDLDLRPRPIADRAQYLRLFDGGSRARQLGEGSVLYLYSKAAPEEMRALSPDAKVIVLLRDPVEMVSSLHAHNLLLNHEDLPDLEQALAAEADRREGRRIPPACAAPLALQYRAVARFAEHVVRYRETFGPERVRCILHEDLAAEPERVYRETISFLGLEPGGRPEFAPLNQRSRWRSPRAGRLLVRGLRRGSQLARRLPTRGLRTSALAVVGLLSLVPMRLNLTRASRSAPAPELRAELRDAFRDDVGRLGEILERDLSAWHALADPDGV